MNAQIIFNYDPTNHIQTAIAQKILKVMSEQPTLGEAIGVESLNDTYRKIWNACSFEVIALAVTVLNLYLAADDKDPSVPFSSLMQERDTKYSLPGQLSERSISSRVGRSAVICKPYGISVMQVVKADARSVSINKDAAKVLREMLQGKLGKDYNEWIASYGIKPLTFERFAGW